MSTEFYPATGLIGGAAGDLDKIPSATLGDADVALVTIVAKFYVYRFDSSSAAAESSPDVIAPDDIGGNGRWLLVFSNEDVVVDGDIGLTVQAYDINIALFRRHTLESGDDLTIGEDEQKLLCDTFFINGTGSLTINGCGELCVIGG